MTRTFFLALISAGSLSFAAAYHFIDAGNPRPMAVHFARRSPLRIAPVKAPAPRVPASEPPPERQ